jgi:hypothetical protein
VPPPPPPPAPSPVDITGTILLTSGKCPDIAFLILLTTIKADGGTGFSKGNCKDLRPGVGVSVTGTLQSDHTVKATRIGINK